MRAATIRVMVTLLGSAAMGLGPGIAVPTTLGVATPSSVDTPADAGLPPDRLSETGLFVPGTPERLRRGVVEFAPAFGLWSDGAAKRRWIALPPGSSIDASNPDAWQFPVGTRLWKEFAFATRIETRMIERRPDGSWRYATYLWLPDGTDAVRVDARGLRGVEIASSPGGRYDVPSQVDCRSCHEGPAVPVLGFSAVQLGARRPGSTEQHAMPDLTTLVARGIVVNLPASVLQQTPLDRLEPVERAALGYLHANCGHCHTDPRQSDGGVPVDLQLAQYIGNADAAAAARETVLERPTRLHRADGRPASRVGLLLERMQSRDPRLQMPPLGTRVPDADGLQLVNAWLRTTHQRVSRTTPQE